MKKFILLVLAIGLSYPIQATNYFLSDNGVDTNKGTKESPWKTLERLSEATSFIFPGDSIFFERGSVFYGQVNICRSSIYLGPYGSGSKPVFTGSDKIDQWKSIGKNIWRAECPLGIARPSTLSINGKLQSLGRYPNKGFLTVAAAHNPVSVADTTLTFPEGYWNGAEVIVRSSRWTFDHLRVATFEKGVFNSVDRITNPLQNGAGYFIQNHLATLDQPGEWFYDGNSNEIFLYMQPGSTPAGVAIEISVFETGLIVKFAHDVTVDNLAFRQYRSSGIRIQNSNNARIQNIDIFGSGENGLEVIACNNPFVTKTTITDSYNNGVEWHDNTNGNFIGNTVRRTGLYPGRGRTGTGTCIGIYITSDNGFLSRNLFEDNAIDSIGYSGIDFRTGYTHIKNNRISHFCLVKDDGGGVYTWNNTGEGNIIEGNTIKKGIGSGKGTVNQQELFVSGIYIDDLSANVLIKNNTISSCATAGIFLHNAKLITVIGNELFSNGSNIANKERGQLYIKLDALGKWRGKAVLQLKVSHNKLIASREISKCLFISMDKGYDLTHLGKFNQNEYSAVQPSQAIVVFNDQSGLCWAPEQITLAAWHRATQHERGSVFYPLTLKKDILLLSKNLINNGNGTSATDGWMAWPERSSFQKVKKDIGDGLSFKFNIPPNTDALLYHAGFALSSEKLYRLSFSVMTTKPGKLEFVTLMAKSPWGALGDYTCFSIDSTRKTFTYFFKPLQSNPDARVNFKSNATFWIDNVSLFEVALAQER